MKLTSSQLKKIIKEEVAAALEEARMSVRDATEAIADRFEGAEALRGLPRAGQRSGTTDDYQYTIRNKVIFSHNTRAPKGETYLQKKARLKKDKELGIKYFNDAFDALMEEGEPIEEGSYVKTPMILWKGLVLKKMMHSFGHDSGTWIYPAIGVATRGAKSVKARPAYKPREKEHDSAMWDLDDWRERERNH
jgi:hypothetical protein